MTFDEGDEQNVTSLPDIDDGDIPENGDDSAPVDNDDGEEDEATVSTAKKVNVRSTLFFSRTTWISPLNTKRVNDLALISTNSPSLLPRL